MPNPNPKQENLNHFKPKWKNTPTKTIRVPEKFADELLAIARQFDNGSSVALRQARS
jgi:hypothetical protein